MDQQRKRELKNAWKQQEQQKLIASLPASKANLRDLFDYLDRGGIECDHTLRPTVAFLKDRELDVETIVAWLHEHGGFCDCEVIYNVDPTFAEILRD